MWEPPTRFNDTTRNYFEKLKVPSRQRAVAPFGGFSGRLGAVGVVAAVAVDDDVVAPVVLVTLVVVA